MQKPYGENVDFLDSFLGCIWGFGTGDLLGEQKKKVIREPQKQTTFKYEMDSQGRLKRVTVQI